VWWKAERVTTARERKRKERERRAASRRLPPLRGRGGPRLQTGRGRPVRMVGIGQFSEGMARRGERRRQTHGWRRVGGVITAVLATAVLVLVLIGRVAGHL
jgi:hypothetical protein